MEIGEKARIFRGQFLKSMAVIPACPASPMYSILAQALVIASLQLQRMGALFGGLNENRALPLILQRRQD